MFPQIVLRIRIQTGQAGGAGAVSATRAVRGRAERLLQSRPSWIVHSSTIETTEISGSFEDEKAIDNRATNFIVGYCRYRRLYQI